MENEKESEIEDILLKDMPLFRNNKNVLNFFKSLKIFTLKELLSRDDIFDLINVSKISATTKNETRGLVELARYKYLGEPLVMDAALDNVVTIIYHGLPNEDFDFGEVTLDRFGFSQNEISRIRRYLLLKKTNGEYYRLNNNLSSVGTILEILTAFLHMRNVNKFSLDMKEKISLYRKAYYEQQNIAHNVDAIEIEALQAMLDKLSEKAAEYKKTIITLQTSLDKRINNGDESYGKR